MVLIMVILLLRIGFLQNIIDPLVNVLNSSNKLDGFDDLRLNMGIFCLCAQNRQCEFNGTEWLKSQPNL